MGLFCQVVTSCLNKYVPLKKVSSKYSKCPTPSLAWMTPEIMSAIKEKQRAKHAAECSDGNEEIALYKRLKNMVPDW